jgi:hypothetical protein
MQLSRFQNENRNHSCAFFAASPQKTGLFGGSAAACHAVKADLKNCKAIL